MSVSAALGLEEAREVTRRHARSFHFASKLLPRERRDAACTLYAFCRSADDAVDEAEDLDLAERRARLEHLRFRLDRVYRQRPTCDVDAALASVVAKHDIPREPFERLLEGLELDLSPIRLRTSGELLRYCHLVAGVVGHLLLPVLGARAAEARDRAADLGVAMQLTNILRDVDEDLGRGRIYLPEEELAAFGLTHDDVRARRSSPAWLAFVAAQIARARSLYARAAEGIPLIETWTGRLCVRAMGSIYGDILRALERQGGDPFRGRAVVGGGRKMVLLAAAFANLPRTWSSPETALCLPPRGTAS